MRILLALLLGCLAYAGEGDHLAGQLQSEAVAYAQSQAQNAGGQYVVRATRSPVLPRITGAEVRFEPSHLSKREPTGPFFAVFRVMVDGRLAGNARVELEGRWTGTLLRTKDSLPKKAVPTEEQLEEFPFEGNPPPGALTTFPAGYRLRASMPAAHILTHADLEPIPLVNTGERVRISVHSGALIISADAIARSYGALGDKVRVELPTRKWVQGIVTGSGEAMVAWGN